MGRDTMNIDLKKYYLVSCILLYFVYAKNLQGSSFSNNNELKKEEILSLPKCIEMAMDKNPDIVQAKKEVNKYSYQLKESYSKYYPSINVEGSYSRTKSKGSDISKEYNYVVKLSQDIFKSGGNYSKIKQAKAELEIKYQEYKKVKKDVIFSLKSNYYQLLKRKHLINVYRAIVERRKADAYFIKLLYDSGRKKRANYLRAEAETEKERIDLYDIENELKIYTLKINRRRNSASLTSS